MNDQHIDLSTSRLGLALRAFGGRLHLERFGASEVSSLQPRAPSGLFAVMAGGQRWDVCNLELAHIREETAPVGSRHVLRALRAPGLLVEQHVQVYGAEALVELWPVIHNEGTAPFGTDRIDTVAPNHPNRPAELLCYTENWASEFEPHREPLAAPVLLEARSGRSSKGHHPSAAFRSSTRPA